MLKRQVISDASAFRSYLARLLIFKPFLPHKHTSSIHKAFKQLSRDSSQKNSLVMHSLPYISYIVIDLLLILTNQASTNSEFNAFTPMVTSSDVSDGFLSDPVSPVGSEAQAQAIPGPDLFSSADDTLPQTDIQSRCAFESSNGKAKVRTDGEICKPEEEKRPMNLPLEIYDPQKVIDSLEYPNTEEDLIDRDNVEEFQKKQDQYRAWNDFLTDDNPNKCQNQENPFYDIHVCCKGPFGKYNGLSFDWALGCSLRTFFFPF